MLQHYSFPSWFFVLINVLTEQKKQKPVIKLNGLKFT